MAQSPNPIYKGASLGGMCKFLRSVTAIIIINSKAVPTISSKAKVKVDGESAGLG